MNYHKKGLKVLLILCEGNVLYIAEGYATAASIHEATGVTVAFSAGILLSVAKKLRENNPEAKLKGKTRKHVVRNS